MGASTQPADDPAAAALRTSDELAETCRIWLDSQGAAVYQAKAESFGFGISVLTVMISGRVFLVECRGGGPGKPPHPTQAHRRRWAGWLRNGARGVSIRTLGELRELFRGWCFGR